MMKKENGIGIVILILVGVVWGLILGRNFPVRSTTLSNPININQMQDRTLPPPKYKIQKSPAGYRYGMPSGYADVYIGLNNNEVVHTPTEKQYNEACEIASGMGAVWSDAEWKKRIKDSRPLQKSNKHKSTSRPVVTRKVTVTINETVFEENSINGIPVGTLGDNLTSKMNSLASLKKDIKDIQTMLNKHKILVKTGQFK